MNASQACGKAGELLRGAQRVVVLTGAGVSTESGIPDFRSPAGLWSRYDPAKLTYDRFCSSAETRRMYWEIASEAYPVLRDARPNEAHLAVVAIEKAGKLSKLVTQNVDGLHEKAGSSVERTIEIHGSALRALCIDCESSQDREAMHDHFLKTLCPPRCDSCGGRVKPATVSFGQPMPERETAEAFRAARGCDLMIVIGSSLVVYPAAALPEEAVQAGAALLIVNREPTGHDGLAAVTVRGSAAESMAMIIALAGMEMPAWR